MEFFKNHAIGTCFWSLIMHLLVDRLPVTERRKQKYFQSAFTIVKSYE
jgi:hypothetical protein